ncbi:DUF2637 domain-containing protein [Polymorphospora sp. NPDC051019]|uniref:DUF2637 domain-containing protein n=1 Tax=Polymorphospora sp. NPDC051019 TaxID=3155725 RepID=UPI00342E935E
MLAIGGAAGAASFTHVRDVAAAHGQPGWLAWADAIVLELMSIASGLELRRRKRAGKSTVFPATVLACAVTLSLAAQVVEAEPSPIGWIAAAVPALGFLVMVKIALGYADTASATEPTGPVRSDAPAGDRPTTDTAPPDGRDPFAAPVPVRTVADRTVHQPGRDRRPSGPDHHKTNGPPQDQRTTTPTPTRTTWTVPRRYGRPRRVTCGRTTCPRTTRRRGAAADPRRPGRSPAHGGVPGVEHQGIAPAEAPQNRTAAGACRT